LGCFHRQTAHTTIKAGFFADNYLYLYLTYFAAPCGMLHRLIGGSRNAPPSNEDIDITRVAVTALTEPSKPAGKTYRPTGPSLLAENGKRGFPAMKRIKGSWL
jgi:hypothetical protein